MQAVTNMSRRMKSRGVCFVSMLLLAVSLGAQERIRCVTYNVENLFDCKDDPLTDDDAFLPASPRHWTPYRYWDKLHAVGRSIASMGDDRAPDLVALCEVENDSVLHDLTRRSPLRSAGYDCLVTSSTDPRGIDVALLYKPTAFRPFAVRSLRLPEVHVPEGRYARDVLCVSGQLVSADTLDLLICHLPSRINGRQSTALRCKVVEYMLYAIDSLSACRGVPHVVVMGDFNDTPYSRSLAPLTAEELLVCVTDTLSGSYRYKGRWEQIDHVFLSPSLCDASNSLHLSSRGAWIPLYDFLVEPEPLYGGIRPNRTYNGMRYEGGTSDHLPVCFDLEFSWRE